MAEIVEFNGKRYSINNHGYYRSTHKGSQTQLHRDVWEFYSGKCIPKGYVIHHIDKNKTNNSFDNLLCCTVFEHAVFHKEEKSILAKERSKDIDFINQFKENAKIARDNLKNIVKVCAFCGKEYVPTNLHQMYCSKSCIEKHDYKICKGRVERTCQYCGEKFMGVRRKYRKFCSRTCSARYGAELIKSKSVC